MADETQTQGEGGGQTQTQPPFDPAALQSSITETIKSTLGDMAKQAYQPSQPTPVVQQPQPDPMRELLNPYMAPLQLQNQMAQDAAVFYATTQEAATHSGEIEQMAGRLTAEGRAMPRSDIWRWIQGSPDYQAKLVERKIAEHTAALQAAQAGQVVGVGSPGRAYNQPVKDARELSPDELATALNGVSF